MGPPPQHQHMPVVLEAWVSVICRSPGLRTTGPTEQGWSAGLLWCCMLPTPWHRDRVWGSIPCAVTAGGSADGGGMNPTTC